MGMPIQISSWLLVTFLWVLICQVSLQRILTQEIEYNVDLRQLLTAINVTLDTVVDGSIEELGRVYHRGNLCPFKRKVIRKLAHGKDIDVMIIGGSVTYGADLSDRLNQRWSNIFTNILTSGWYKGSIRVNNIGVGACNADVWIDRVHEMTQADIILVDLTVNDQTYDLRLLPHLYRTLIQAIDAGPNHPALLFHQAFRTGKDSFRELENHCPALDEQGSCCGGGYYFCKKWWQMQDYVAIALHMYGVPYISYRDLAWPNYDIPPDNLNIWWNGMSHPDAKAHKLIGKMMAFAFYMQIKEAHRAEHCETDEHARYVSADQFDESLRPVCETPLTKMWAGDSQESQLQFETVPPSNIQAIDSLAATNPAMSPPMGWRFFADSKNKYGWILQSDREQFSALCANEPGSPPFCAAAQDATVISFPVLFGPQPRLQIAYLISYAPEMANARVWVDDARHDGVRLAGLWEERYSITQVATIVASADDPAVRGGSGSSDGGDSRSSADGSDVGIAGLSRDTYIMPSLTPGPHTVHIAAAQLKKSSVYKWKLLGITSC